MAYLALRKLILGLERGPNRLTPKERIALDVALDSHSSTIGLHRLIPTTALKVLAELEAGNAKPYIDSKVLKRAVEKVVNIHRAIQRAEMKSAGRKRPAGRLRH